VEAVLIGDDAGPLAPTAVQYGATRCHLVRHDALTDYAPEAWGESLAQLATATNANAVVAVGTDRGNEVLAHAAAAGDLPFAANVVAVHDVEPGAGEWHVTRLRWGGSLLERATLTGTRHLLSVAPHTYAAEPAAGDVADTVETATFEPILPADAARTRVVDRVILESGGGSLAAATVVVSGGRGVGSPEGFAVLEELASLLGAAVGCSRVATNAGWRPHADQVGQTGKRIAPDLYIACGISGAIQHWVGMMAAKRVLAINTDREAPMVQKADHAVIGDLHAVLPAIIAELRRRKEGGAVSATSAPGHLQD
jgi:electron transfer flavoprotein alpha subunit